MQTLPVRSTADDSTRVKAVAVALEASTAAGEEISVADWASWQLKILSVLMELLLKFTLRRHPTFSELRCIWGERQAVLSSGNFGSANWYSDSPQTDSGKSWSVLTTN